MSFTTGALRHGVLKSSEPLCLRGLNRFQIRKILFRVERGGAALAGGSDRLTIDVIKKPLMQKNRSTPAGPLPQKPGSGAGVA